MKVCSGPCRQKLPLTNFRVKNKHTGARRSSCIECQKLYANEHYKENKPYYKKKARVHTNKTREENYRKLCEYLSQHPCVDCEEDDIVVLEFDHIEGKKIREVTRMVSFGCSWETIETEIKKCVVRCANCHMRKTAKQFKWRKLTYVKTPL